MAELVQVEAVNFRAFPTATISLSTSGLVLVAGPNNSGKSALLSVFDVLAGTTPEKVHHYFGDRAGVTAMWLLDEQERLALLGRTPDPQRLVSGGVAQHLVWEFGELHGLIQPTAVRFNYRDDWRYLARLEATSSRGGWQMHTARAQDALNGEELDKSSRTSGNGDPIRDSLEHFHAIPVARDVLRKWRSGYFHFRPLRQVSGRSAPLTNVSPKLAADGSNLATVLLYLQTNEQHTWSKLLRLIASIIPDVGELMTPVSGGACEITFMDPAVKGRFQHNLKDLGTGVEQLLMLLVVGLTRAATTVVLEDPEIGLHPSAQRALLSLLQDWSRRRVVLAATHSATMLDWTSPSSTVIAVRRRAGVSTASLVTTERAEVLRELGVRMSDVLSAERILILEGPTDKEILDAWFHDVLRSPQMVVLMGGGGYDARHADLLAEWLEAADRLSERRILYIRDRDELSGDFLSKLEASKNVFMLPGREIENLLLDYEAIAEVINEELRRQGNPLIAGEQVAGVARSTADRLKQTVVMKRVMADLAEPIRLVDNNMRKTLARSIPTEETLTAAAVSRIPERTEVEARIGTAWAIHSQAIESSWDSEWENLAPGADVLKGIWMHFLSRGYSKAQDGPALARRMKNPPIALRTALKDFMGNPENAIARVDASAACAQQNNWSPR
ncbi:AAA family ATPase [Streptomyces sp. NPDC093225]|uniref:AAA family ATPase n=1 Tax=Streptomyces sp. NPDC093225 TaxID=3366034 RepID=UPI00380A0F7A